MADGKLVIFRETYTSCSINLRGAVITSWRVRDKELLFVSRNAEYDGKKTIYGGVVMGFPHFPPFVPYRGKVDFNPLHVWQVKSGPTTDSNYDVLVVLETTDTMWTKSMWNIPYKMTLSILLQERTLNITTCIENTSEEPAMFHLYTLIHLRLPGSENTQISGLNGTTYFDLTEGKDYYDRETLQDDETGIDVNNNWIDRIYINSPNTLSVLSGKNVFELVSSNFKDCRVWNPGEPTHDQIFNYLPDDYTHFVAVGMGYMASTVDLLAGRSIETQIQLSYNPQFLAAKRMEEITEEDTKGNFEIDCLP